MAFEDRWRKTFRSEAMELRKRQLPNFQRRLYANPHNEFHLNQ
jgi:hypothetical protein